MDILSIKPVLRTLVVRHPATGEPVGLELDYRSMDAPEVKAVERQIRNKSLRAGRASVTAEKIESTEYDILAAVVVAWRWSNGMKLGELENPPLTSDNIRKLFKSATWIKKQLDEELQDEAGFFKTPEPLSGQN